MRRATRSTSSTTPITRPVGDSTGKWRSPRSNISARTSPARRSAVAVYAGADIAAVTGASPLRPPATTFCPPAVGENAKALLAQVDDDRRPRPGAHELGRVTDGGPGAADDGLAADEAAHGLIGGVDRRLAGQHVQLARLLEQRPRHEAHPLRRREDRSGLVGGDPIAERVLRRPGV